MNIPIRSGKKEHTTVMDKFYKKDYSEGSYYYRVYIERRKDVYNEIDQRHYETVVLEELFDKRIHFMPTFIMWSFQWYTDDFSPVLMGEFLIQCNEPVSEKKMQMYISSKTMMDIVWNIELIQDSYEFIEKIIDMHKEISKTTTIWTVTANGKYSENVNHQESFYHSPLFIENLAQKEYYDELIKNEEWGQLLLW